MKRLTLSLSLFLVLGLVSSQTYVELILDASGSMWNKLEDGQYRITAAKDVLNNFIRGLPTGDFNVGLRVYGSQTAALAEGACEDSNLFVPLAGVDKAALKNTIDQVTATGATPIVYSLQKAAQDFPAEATRRMIVLVTDGEESCGGNLQQIAEDLRKQGLEIELKIIGFALSENAQKGFEGIGEFINAADAEQLAGALEGAVKEVVVEPEPVERANLSLTVPASVQAGKAFDVAYDVPDLDANDYITVVPKGAADDEYKSYTFIESDKNLTLTSPFEAGEYEVRYMANSEVLARAALIVEASDITLQFPAEVMAGSDIQVTWTGPNGQDDYITIVPAGSPEGTRKSEFYTKDTNPGLLIASLEPGQYEVRYATDRSAEDGKIFHSQPITIFPAIIELQAPTEVGIGQQFEISWTGPNGKDDYITIVPVGSPEGTYKSYFYTKDANPGKLTAPDTAGQYEIRYSSDNRQNGGKIFYSISIVVK